MLQLVFYGDVENQIVEAQLILQLVDLNFKKTSHKTHTYLESKLLKLPEAALIREIFRDGFNFADLLRKGKTASLGELRGREREIPLDGSSRSKRLSLSGSTD